MKIAAIIPAYNEFDTIADVIEPVLRADLVNEVIVVSDGSTDGTPDIARAYPVKVIELEHNMGKGAAMKIGAANTTADVLLFLDADLKGLRENHIRDLLEPIINGDTEMTIGIFEHGRFATDLAQKLTPFLSGQRAVYKRMFDAIPNLESSGYGVEISLSRYAEMHNMVVTNVLLRDLTHVMKEEKKGLFRGTIGRLQMYWEIIKQLGR